MSHLTVTATTARLVSRAQLTLADLSGMHHLLSRHFDGVSTEQFQQVVTYTS